MTKRTRAAPAAKHPAIPAPDHLKIDKSLREQLPEVEQADFYCLIVDGRCLEPRIRHGDYIVVAPHAPIQPGDLAVFYIKGREANPAIKRLVVPPPPNWATWKIDSDSEVVPAVIVEQDNPPKQMTTTVDRLAAIHRVIASVRREDAETYASEELA